MKLWSRGDLVRCEVHLQEDESPLTSCQESFSLTTVQTVLNYPVAYFVYWSSILYVRKLVTCGYLPIYIFFIYKHFQDGRFLHIILKNCWLAWCKWVPLWREAIKTHLSSTSNALASIDIIFDAKRNLYVNIAVANEFHFEIPI